MEGRRDFIVRVFQKRLHVLLTRRFSGRVLSNLSFVIGEMAIWSGRKGRCSKCVSEAFQRYRFIDMIPSRSAIYEHG